MKARCWFCERSSAPPADFASAQERLVRASAIARSAELLAKTGVTQVDQILCVKVFHCGGEFSGVKCDAQVQAMLLRALMACNWCIMDGGEARGIIMGAVWVISWLRVLSMDVTFEFKFEAMPSS